MEREGISLEAGTFSTSNAELHSTYFDLIKRSSLAINTTERDTQEHNYPHERSLSQERELRCGGEKERGVVAHEKGNRVL